ncbi:MAG TPA: GTPase [Lacipirellulaceae bacterium]
MPAATSTYVVELTPVGKAAVAVVLVAGPDAMRAVDECFTALSGRQIREAPVARIILGRWGGPDGEELLVCRRAIDQVEVHCHGGTAAVRSVIERLCERGCKPTSWHDWLLRADSDPIRAAAQIALADAPTARTAAILLDQYHGALTAMIRRAIDAADSGRWPAAMDSLDALLKHRATGMHLTSPWQVVIAGPPNVGKSSLLNALIGYQRAIVCDLPGTTRDVVGASTAIDGWPIQFSDTAGLHDTRDELESAGIEQATAALASAALVLLVAEPTDGIGHTTSSYSLSRANIDARLPRSVPVVRVHNKIDLLAARDRVALGEQYDVLTSAITGHGIAALIAAIGQSLVSDPPAEGAAVPFAAEQVQRLEMARATVHNRDATAVVASLHPLLSSN